MWVFASKLPGDALLVAPRGLHPAPLGGYSWHEYKGKPWAWVDDFRPAAEILVDLIARMNFTTSNLENLRLLGFSQGAALAFTFCLLNPGRVRAVAALSGYLPDGFSAMNQNQPLAGLPVFMAHGTKDRLVPVERARKSVRILQQRGAQVSYCEDEVGHKLSADCFRAMQAFFVRF